MAGTGVIADPNAIKAYGTAVGRQEGQLAQINSALAGVHLGANAFGKLPEAGDLYNAYTSHSQDIRAITAKLPEQISNVAEGLYGTASSYADLESEMADGIRQIFGTPSGGSGGKSVAGEAIGGFANIVSQTRTYYGWVNEPESALPAFAVDNLYGASNWMEGTLDAAINWVINHVPELPKLLDDVTGDTEALKAAAETWHRQGDALNDVARGLKAAAVNLPESWAGEASSSFGSFMSDVTKGLGELAGAMGQTQQILEEAAAEAEFAHETIVMIIREVVEWVVGNILVDALTLGLATAVEAPATAAFLADKVAEAEQAASKLASVYRALQKMLQALKEVKGLEEIYKGFKDAKGLGRLKKFMTVGKDLDKALEVGKLKNLRVFGNGKLADAAKVVWGAGKHDKELKEAEELGKDGVIRAIKLKAGMAGVTALTGLSADPGPVGLAKGLLEGSLSDVGENGQGAADAIGLGPAIPPAPPVNKVDALINSHVPPKES